MSLNYPYDTDRQASFDLMRPRFLWGKYIGDAPAMSKKFRRYDRVIVGRSRSADFGDKKGIVGLKG
jgi:hypothetical protein